MSRFYFGLGLLINVLATGPVQDTGGNSGDDYLVRIDGIQAYAGFGHDLACGDFDGNGVADLAIGAPGEDTVYLFLGSQDLRKGSAVRSAELSAVGGDPGSLFGYSLEAADFDSDGHSELLIGAPQGAGADSGSIGQVALLGLLDGSLNKFLATGRARKLAAAEMIWTAGKQVRGLGQSVGFTDLNGDGLLDLVAGAPATRAAGKAQAGVVMGRLLTHTGLGPEIAGPTGEVVGRRFGASLAVLGETIAVGGPGSGDLPGTVVFFAGEGLRPGGNHASLTGEPGFGEGLFPVDEATLAIGNPSSATVQISSVAEDGPATGPLLYGTSPVAGVVHETTSLGHAFAGWANVGGRKLAVAGLPESNRVLFVEIDPASPETPLPGKALFQISRSFHDIQVVRSPDEFGYSVRACDVDGDDVADVAVSAPGNDGGQAGRLAGAGSVFVYSGSDLLRNVNLQEF